MLAQDVAHGVEFILLDLFESFPLFWDMLGEGEKGYFDDTNYVDEDFGPLYNYDGEDEIKEDIQEEEEDIT